MSGTNSADACSNMLYEGQIVIRSPCTRAYKHCAIDEQGNMERSDAGQSISNTEISWLRLIILERI